MKDDPETNEEEIPTPSALPEKEPDPIDEAMTLEPMKNAPTLANVIDALLKFPGRVLYELREGQSMRVARQLAVLAFGAMLLFGFVLGIFSGGEQLWAAPVKLAGGMAVAVLITLPSLYVFSCLGGMDITPQKAAGLILTAVALLGLILSALCPVAWIFTQSTSSVGMMGFLTLLFWLVAISFGISRLFRSAKKIGLANAQYLRAWIVIFVVVTLQMSTSLRPIIGPAEDTFFPTEKRFFLSHWEAVVSGED